MSGFDALLDQERPVRLLTAAIRSGHLPHAYLFSGTEGVGKKTAAMAFAMACNCRKSQADLKKSAPPKRHPGVSDDGGVNPCGECPACKKIISGNHPDIHIIRPSGTIIKVDEVRALCGKLALKPYEARLRVALIADAHLMNPEAGNTLLKILEEPPDRTVFILTAPQASALLPTIRSRCRHIRFNPISSKSLKSHLEDAFGFTPDTASALASMAGGSITLASQMAGSEWIRKRDWIIEQIESAATSPINCTLAFSEALSGNKHQMPAAFTIMKNWFRDLVIYRVSPEHIVNKDLKQKIQIASKQATIEDLLSKIAAIEKAEHDIKVNANPRLIFDTLAIMLIRDSLPNGKNNRGTV